jgi:hypothetical protein
LTTPPRATLTSVLAENPADRPATTLDFMVRKGRRPMPRLEAESARRGQAGPKVLFPGEAASLRE